MRDRYGRFYFDPDQVKGNKYKSGDAWLVRIPNIPGRISKRNQDHSTYVDFVYKRWYDPEKKVTKKKRVIIGTFIREYRDFMYPNENYFEFFDADSGELIRKLDSDEEPETVREGTEVETEPMTEEEIARFQKEAEAASKTQERKKEGGKPAEKKPKASTTWEELVQLAREKKAEIELEEEQQKKKEESEKERIEQEAREMERKEQEDRELQEVKEKIEAAQKYKAYYKLYYDMLDRNLKSIQKMAQKYPDTVMSLYKAERLNDVLNALKGLVKDSEVEGKIETIPLPTVEEIKGESVLTGLTYSDVQILLDQYVSIVLWHLVQHLTLGR